MRMWPTPKPAVLAAVTILHHAFTNGQYALVSTKLPRNTGKIDGLVASRPERFVTVTRVGGSQIDPTVDMARILVQCYSKDTPTCEAMTGTARSAFREACSTWVVPQDENGDPSPEQRMFIRWYGNESGLADLAHPDILDYERWQFTAELWVKANH